MSDRFELIADRILAARLSPDRYPLTVVPLAVQLQARVDVAGLSKDDVQLVAIVCEEITR